MLEGNRRQATIIFVVAGIFLVGLLLVGLGIVKQQNKNIASNDQPSQQTNQPVKKEADDKDEQKPAEQAQPQKPAPQPANPQPSPVPASGNVQPLIAPPQAVPATGPAALPATGSSFDLAIGAALLTLTGFVAFRFSQSRQALLPKL